MINLAVVDNLSTAINILEFLVRERPDISLVANASNGREAIEMIEKHQPDVVLMNIVMPIMDGIDATKIINQRFANTKIILITGCDNQRSRKMAIKAGANGYISKFADLNDISLAIDHVAAGYEFFSFSRIY